MRVAMDPDLDLALRCAWLSLVGGYTHEEIAARVFHLAREGDAADPDGPARRAREGLDRGAPRRNAPRSREQLVARYGLAQCSVAPDLGELGLPVSALGALGAHVIRSAIERDDVATVGLGHGRTLSACIDAMPLMTRPGLKIVSLLGSLTRDSATTPYDVIFRLASRTGGTGYCLAAPFVCACEAGSQRIPRPARCRRRAPAGFARCPRRYRRARSGERARDQRDDHAGRARSLAAGGGGRRVSGDVRRCGRTSARRRADAADRGDRAGGGVAAPRDRDRRRPRQGGGPSRRSCAAAESAIS